MTARAHITLKTKLASTLLALGDIPYDDAKMMTADQVLSLYQFDHGILHAIEPNDQFWNLTPTLIAPHRRKSRRDTSITAKAVRIDKSNAAFRARLLAKDIGEPVRRRSRIQSRGFAKGQRKMGMRG